MTKGKTVTLGPHFDEFVSSQVTAGRFANVSEVVRAGLRLLEDEETKLKALRAALTEGKASGPAAALDWEDLQASLRREYQAA